LLILKNYTPLSSSHMESRKKAKPTETLKQLSAVSAKNSPDLGVSW
jgi:hypothetical protein